VSEKLLAARELAELLGFAAGTIVDWAERGDVPCFKVGGRLRFRESEVVDWLEQRRVNGPGTRGEVSATPSNPRPWGVSSQASATPQGGESS
jgi:excisionase family DNA binding protein